MAFPAVLNINYSDVYETGTVQLYPIGQTGITPDGSIFRYAEIGATVGVANKMYQSEGPTANWLSQAATTALVVGDTTIGFTDGGTAVAVNELAGGTVLVEETDDLGHIYRIKSNTVSAGAAAFILTLENGVTVQVAVAVAGGNVLSLIKNPYKDIIIAPTTLTTTVVGIPRVIIAANAYGWVQTRGVASCLVAGTMVVGRAVSPATAAAGALGPARASGTATVLSAQTTIAVTHGLGGTPILGNIKIVGGENATTPVDKLPWVDTIGATQFTINVTADPGVSNQDFGWEASLATEPVGYCVEVAPTGDFGHVFLNLN